MSGYYPKRYGRYITQPGDSIIPDPPAVLTFRSDFLDGNITPETGTGGTFTRTGAKYYNQNNTDVGLTASGAGSALVEGFVYGNTSFSNGGIQITCLNTNHCLQASTPATAPWTSIGTVSVSNGFATGPDNTALSAARVRATAIGDGVRQPIGAFTNVEGRGFVWSVYLRAASGTPSITLKIYNETDTVNATTNATLSTTWTRYDVSIKFGIGITNGLRVDYIINTASGDTYFFGSQVEESGSTYGNMTKRPTNYVRTTTAVASSNADELTYPSSNFTSLSSGSVNVWVAPMYGSTDWQAESANEKYIFSMNGTNIAITLAWNGTSSRVRGYYNGALAEVDATFNREDWQMFTLTWNNLNPTIDLKLYLNGSLIANNTTSSVSTISANTMYIGRATSGTNNTYSNGIISLFKYYTGVLTASEISTIFTSELGNF